MTKEELIALADAIERIGHPLRWDAFNEVLCGEQNFEAMILRDDEPGSSAILAQNMTDQMAADFCEVVNTVAAALRARGE